MDAQYKNTLITTKELLNTEFLSFLLIKEKFFHFKTLIQRNFYLKAYMKHSRFKKF